MEAREPVSVYTVTTEAEAEMIRNLLHAEGIACELGGMSQAGLAGVLQIDVLVRAEDVDKASKIIKKQQKGR